MRDKEAFIPNNCSIFTHDLSDVSLTCDRSLSACLLSLVRFLISSARSANSCWSSVERVVFRSWSISEFRLSCKGNRTWYNISSSPLITGRAPRDVIWHADIIWHPRLDSRLYWNWKRQWATLTYLVSYSPKAEVGPLQDYELEKRTCDVIIVCSDVSSPVSDLSCWGRLLVIRSCSSLHTLKSLFILSYTSLATKQTIDIIQD